MKRTNSIEYITPSRQTTYGANVNCNHFTVTQSLTIPCHLSHLTYEINI